MARPEILGRKGDRGWTGRSPKGVAVRNRGLFILGRSAFPARSVPGKAGLPKGLTILCGLLSLVLDGVPEVRKQADNSGTLVFTAIVNGDDGAVAFRIQKAD